MALPNGITSTEELLDAQAHIWSHVFSFINSMSLKCVVQLGIPDVIHRHGKPMKLPELADALSIDRAKTPCLERLMRLMIHSKFFVGTKISEDSDQDGYWLTPSSRLLLRDEPASSLASFVLYRVDPNIMDPCHSMSKWFRTDHGTPFFTTYGMEIWEYAGKDARFNMLFNEAMASDARLVSGILIRDCRHIFEELRSIVDVGGGVGVVSKAIVDAFPGLKCTVVDLPHVVAGLESTKDLIYLEGDMFEFIPSADAVFMKWILHDWPDDKCVKILKNCKAAIPSKEKGGKVMIVDMVLGEESLETQLLFDMQMMICLSGKERTEKQWADLFTAAGFSSYKITNIFGLRHLIEVFY
ncbi:trans-resveratrol di-O-methyltransferase-like [Andrographis paniculata]|uniref:trans-resveratrol di-O-methyltransferase-like n=1 Tax=Andrographis paniculata TaxID=175694 RepID=UPI0021E77361|nr:trans-resveratrol di-O-methyltransferase-like [Andrographis paniculata]